MSDLPHDVLVIGGGPAGAATAYWAARAGLDVVVVVVTRRSACVVLRRLRRCLSVSASLSVCVCVCRHLCLSSSASVFVVYPRRTRVPSSAPTLHPHTVLEAGQKKKKTSLSATYVA